MKCQNCENEANFFFTQTINGETTRVHLCAECAEAAGLLPPIGFALLNAAFGRAENSRGAVRAARTLESLPPMPSFAPTETIEVDGEISRRREINVLRGKMYDASRREDFESAARLRDEINALERA